MFIKEREVVKLPFGSKRVVEGLPREPYTVAVCLALFITYLKPNNMAPNWSQNGSRRHHFIHISLYSHS